jgi:hypothetical protein
MVKKALVDAYRMLRRVGGRVGPSGLKAAWPEFQNNPEDYAPAATKVAPAYQTAITVTRMEHALLGWHDEDGDHPAWLNGALLSYEHPRKVLLEWIRAEIRGESFTALCQRKRWAYTTACSQRDRAAYIIADRLNRLRVAVW